MEDKSKNKAITALSILSLFLLVAFQIQSNVYKEAAIENGCAQYSPQTGNFEWRLRK